MGKVSEKKEVSKKKRTRNERRTERLIQAMRQRSTEKNDALKRMATVEEKEKAICIPENEPETVEDTLKRIEAMERNFASMKNDFSETIDKLGKRISREARQPIQFASKEEKAIRAIAMCVSKAYIDNADEDEEEK